MTTARALGLSRRQLLRSGAGAGLAGSIAWPLGTAGATAATSTETSAGFVNDGGVQVVNVTNPAFGVKGDTIRSSLNGNTTAGSERFTQTTAGTGPESSNAAIEFDPATDIGKVITIQGAGPEGTVLSTRISSVVDPQTVTLELAASTSVSNAAFAYGTDDTVGIVAAVAAAGDSGTLFFPAAIYTILGSSNGDGPIVHRGRGGILGQGGRYVPNLNGAYRDPNTVLLCSDATAGLIVNGCARYENFMCDGNHIAKAPLQQGIVSNGAVVDSASDATFSDVWASKSTDVGWAIYGARNSTYYDCGTSHNEHDGLYIDGGAEGLDFFHFHQRSDRRYGIHGDHLVAASTGSTVPTRHIRFFSGLCDGAGGDARGVSKVYLRGAIDWSFPEMIIVGTVTGPTVDLDQSLGHDLDFSDCWIFSDGKEGVDDVCIQISGTPPDDRSLTFVETGGCFFTQADKSIHVLGDPRSYRYSAIGGWWDVSRSGPVVAPGLPAADTLFSGRTGRWRTAALSAPWTGTVTYRFMGERWVELRGSARSSVVGAGPLFALPLGYRPGASARRVPATAGTDACVVEISADGEVSALPIGAGPFPADTTVSFDGASFPIEGDEMQIDR